MSRIKYAVDSPHTSSWAAPLGRLIMNFSAVEFESYLWLIQMLEEHADVKVLTKMLFGKRVERILELLKARSHSPAWKKQADALWAEALDLAKLRNRVAHNPLGFAWSTGMETGEPDMMGFIDMKAAAAGNNKYEAFLSKAELNRAINSVARVAQDLSKSRKTWCDVRDRAQSEKR